MIFHLTLTLAGFETGMRDGSETTIFPSRRTGLISRLWCAAELGRRGMGNGGAHEHTTTDQWLVEALGSGVSATHILLDD